MPKLRLTKNLRRACSPIGPPAFTPLSLSPALWLDASDASTLYQSNGGAAAAADGDPVGYWLDKSGNGKHATQVSGTNKPLLKLAIKNSRPVLRFNGTSSCLSHALTLSAASTVAGIFTVTGTGSGTHQVLSCSPAGTPIKAQMVAKTGLINQWGGFWNAWNRSGINTLNAWNAAVITDSGSGTVNMYNNGGASPVATFTGVSYYTDSTNDRRIVAGPGSVAGEYLTGDISELLVIPGVISASNLASLFSYLNSKWAVY